MVSIINGKPYAGGDDAPATHHLPNLPNCIEYLAASWRANPDVDDPSVQRALQRLERTLRT